MTQTAHHTSTGFSVPGLIVSIVSSIYSTLIRVAEAQSRIRQIEFLQSLSDEELQKRGLRREQIVHQVFANSIWL